MTTRPLPGLRSSYVEYLPPPLQSDAFMGRFLLIIESVVAPIEKTIDDVADYFDPSVTPEAFLPWLAGWVGQELDEHWPRERWRTLIARAAVLHRWRGTRRALRERVSLYVGRPPLVVENFSGMRIGQDAALGLNTTLGEPIDAGGMLSAPKGGDGATKVRVCIDCVGRAVRAGGCRCDWFVVGGRCCAG